MGIDFHPLHGPVDFSDLFLTASVDWTVKLWRARSIAKPSAQPHTLGPLYSFDEADDYVYDVKWHPQHPALFGAVDGSGRFDLWNLNVDTEVRPLPLKLILPSTNNNFSSTISGSCGHDTCRLQPCNQQVEMGLQGGTPSGIGRERREDVYL